MNHLTDDQLLAHKIDDLALSVEAQTHLDACPMCRAQADGLGHLAAELAVARRSAVTPEQQGRYYALFDQIQQTGSLSPAKVWQRLVASLTWDSRQQPGFAGVRGGNAAFRLLYATAAAEVEFLVEPSTAGQRVQGEILDLTHGKLALPALIQVIDQLGVAQHETTSDGRGRFRLEAVPARRYDFLLTPARGPEIMLDGVDLS